MSRNISIGYEIKGENFDIDVENQNLLGTQNVSMTFWSIQYLQDNGIKELTKLGYMDPVCFVGWEEVNGLEIEILILEKEKNHLDFQEDLKNRWIENLRFCLDELTQLAPPDSIPNFMIG